MTKEIPAARFVAVYSATERAKALEQAPAAIDTLVSLTPNAPLAADGSHLSFWKPSYVIATATGGEAGINFWNIYSGGHVNVGYAVRPAKAYILDCRMISAKPIAYRVYRGNRGKPAAQGQIPLHDGHFLLTVPPNGAGEEASIELWPATATTPVGFLGCELGTYH